MTGYICLQVDIQTSVWGQKRYITDVIRYSNNHRFLFSVDAVVDAYVPRSIHSGLLKPTLAKTQYNCCDVLHKGIRANYLYNNLIILGLCSAFSSVSL